MSEINKFIQKFKEENKKKAREIEIPNEVKSFFEQNDSINDNNIKDFLNSLKILLDYIKTNFASLNYVSLGLYNYEKSGTIEQWNKFYQVILKVYKDEDFTKDFDIFNKDSLNGYQRTGTVSSIIFVLSKGRFPIINGVTKKAIKILELDKDSKFKGKLSKIDLNLGYLENIELFKNILDENISTYEELDRFFYFIVQLSPNYWLISNNPDKYDALNAFRELNEIDWGNAKNNKLEIGDIVYIYTSQPTQAITIKTQVIEIDLKKDDLLDNDSKYNKFPEDRTLDNYFRLKLLQFTDTKRLTLDELLKHGLKSAPQGKQKIESKLIKFIQSTESSDNENFINIEKKEKNNMLNETKQIQPLNQILYGSPGTGKTYNTINKALEIIFQDSLTKEDYENGKVKEERLVELSQNELSEEEKKDIANDSRNLLKACFEKYKNKGQIEFVTFHQSYGYEEFVEGIKAISPDDERNPTDNLIYKVEAGIFKKLCENAKIIKAQTNKLDFDWNRGNIFKMSLGGKSDSEILDWCLDNEYISMGWGNEIDFSSITAQSWESFRDKAKSLYQNLDTDRFTLQAMYAFKEWMKKDDLVFVSLGNLKIVAIGQVIGDYEYKENIDEIRYSQFRKVKWLFIDKSGIPVEKLLNKKLSQQTIYNLDKSYVKKDFLDSLFIENNDEQLKNYVLIIDEINRGNISKIFGELITLIEPSKRIGVDEEIRVKLPYSGDSEEPFGVPKNLYIIGTMNTADRSIAQIDTALRRRFVFEEMAPNPSLLNKDKIKVQVSKDDETDTGIELDKLLEAINTRIEYLYDRDHTIGHAYLIDVKNLDDLKFAFKNKIIPLLAEYFYEDWENIKLVLDDKENKFITVKEKGNHPALSSMDKNYNKKLYSVNDINNLDAKGFISIYPNEE